MDTSKKLEMQLKQSRVAISVGDSDLDSNLVIHILMTIHARQESLMLMDVANR